MKKYIIWGIIIIVALLLYFIPLYTKTRLSITSNSFANGKDIPQQYTCDGENISPQLSWTPLDDEGIKSYVLIVDDPNAQKVVGRTYVHWIVVMPPQVTTLPEGISTYKQSRIHTLDGHAKEMINDSKASHYTGPCPPAHSSTHRYRFTLFATAVEPQELNDMEIFKRPCTAEMFNKAIGKQIIEQARITGMYRARK